MNTEHTEDPTPPPPAKAGCCPLRSRGVLTLLIGLVIGIAATAFAGWTMMPGMMIDRHESRFGIDETVNRLTTAAKELGWSVPAVRNMNESLKKRGVDFAPEVRLVEICKAEYAESVLRSNRELATLMPCAFAVYKGDDGKVYVSGMNTGLMGTMFGGNVAKVMGEQVARDETRILSSVVKGN
jgi:uncharacterized protein (DUF302 family)